MGKENFKNHLEGCLIKRKPHCSQGSFLEFTSRQGEPRQLPTPIFHRWADVKDMKTSIHTEGASRGREEFSSQDVLSPAMDKSLKTNSQVKSILFLDGPPVVDLISHKSQY